MRNAVNKLIFLLLAIKEYSKYIHYSAKGDEFYAVHKLMDFIIENYDGYIDEIKEVCLLGNGIIPAEDYLRQAALLVPAKSTDTKENLKKLIQLIKNTRNCINGIEELDKADENLLGAIDQDLKQKYGLLLRQVI